MHTNNSLLQSIHYFNFFWKGEQSSFIQMLNEEDFKELAITVVQETFEIPLITFAPSHGNNGSDAVANGVSIDCGEQQSTDKYYNVVVRAKQVTECDAEKLLTPEKENIRQLVKNGQLDVYILATNKAIDPENHTRLGQMATEWGVRNIIIADSPVLTKWIDLSPFLRIKRYALISKFPVALMFIGYFICF